MSALVACIAATDDKHMTKVDEYRSDVRPDGFDYHLATSDKVAATASGDEHGNMHGSFQWVDPKGVHVMVDYVADKMGYQPRSDMLPTPPPTPKAILEALEYLKAHPEKDLKH